MKVIKVIIILAVFSLCYWFGISQMLKNTSANEEEGFDVCNIEEFNATCVIGCPEGYSYNSDGCPKCECLAPKYNDNPSCNPSIACPSKCENYIRDENGCATCNCSSGRLREDTSMPLSACNLGALNVDCAIGCPYGYANDLNGCPQCSCFHSQQNSGVCDLTLTCPAKCENYKLDANGCATCECSVLRTNTNEFFCDINAFKTSCSIGCPYGYAYDSTGCPVCHCNETQQGQPEGCDFRQTCPKVCRDYKLDSNGCSSCDCAR